MPEGKVPQIADIVSFGYATLFDLVRHARREDHWALSRQEAQKLGKVTMHCIGTLDDGTKTKVIKRFEKQLPWISLMGFAVVITYPRIAASKQLEEMRKQNRFPQTSFTEEPNAATTRNAPAPPVAKAPSDSEPTFRPGPNPSFPPLDYTIVS